MVHFAYQEYEQAAERFEKVLKIVEGLPSQVRLRLGVRVSELTDYFFCLQPDFSSCSIT